MLLAKANFPTDTAAARGILGTAWQRLGDREGATALSVVVFMVQKELSAAGYLRPAFHSLRAQPLPSRARGRATVGEGKSAVEVLSTSTELLLALGWCLHKYQIFLLAVARRTSTLLASLRYNYPLISIC